MESHRELLRQFVSACKKNPGILHDPQFSFYKEWLESLGAKIPPSPPKADESESKSAPASEPEPVPEPESESEEQVESDVELDMSGVIEGDKDEPLPMGDEVQWVSEEDEEKAIEFKNAALSYFSDGDMEKAIENFTKAIELNPYSAILHAKRASALLKVNKPNAAIRDCDKAIGLNADCAAAYKFRGRAHRLLGNFLEAYQDLATACKLDYDDTANEWLKEVEPNAKKILEHNRNKERRREEKEINKRKERVRKAQEEHRKAAEAEEERNKHQQSSGDGADFGGKIPEGFANILSDPEVLGLLKDETVMAAYSDIMKNPANIGKYISNPKVLKLMEKLGSLTGAFAGAGGFAGAAAPSSAASEGKAKPTTFPNKAPEPDLD